MMPMYAIMYYERVCYEMAYCERVCYVMRGCDESGFGLVWYLDRCVLF